MKKMLFLFAVLVIFLSCSRKDKGEIYSESEKEKTPLSAEQKEEEKPIPVAAPKEIITFEPFKEDMYLEYDDNYYDEKINQRKIIIYRVSSGEKEVLLERYGFPNRLIYFTTDKKKCFFILKNGKSVTPWLSDLWYLNGETGIAETILEVTPAFCISDDGRYICYSEGKYLTKDPYYRGARMVIPVVNIYDLSKREVVYTIDYHDKELKDLWGVGAGMKYDNKKKSFMIIFDIEYFIYLSGRFDLNSMEFIKDEREYPYEDKRKAP